MNIGIIGVGRLGLAYALIFEQKNFTVFASSYKKDYVETLKSKKVSIVLYLNCEKNEFRYSYSSFWGFTRPYRSLFLSIN